MNIDRMFSFTIREENILILRRYGLKYVGVKCRSDSNLYSKKILRNRYVYLYTYVCVRMHMFGKQERRERRGEAKS